MPGTKNYVSANSEDLMVQLQKWLILCNLKEAYLGFQVQNHGKLLAFKSLQSYDHTVYWLQQAVCVQLLHVYQSSECETLILGGKLYDMTKKQIIYDNCLSKIICNVPSVSCYQGECEMGTGIKKVIKNVKTDI
jgi:hypothetical protein